MNSLERSWRLMVCSRLLVHIVIMYKAFKEGKYYQKCEIYTSPYSMCTLIQQVFLTYDEENRLITLSNLLPKRSHILFPSHKLCKFPDNLMFPQYFLLHLSLQISIFLKSNQHIPDCFTSL